MVEKEEKKVPVVDDKRYAIITRESVKVMAEAGGYSDLCDEAAALLSEDVTYRLREAIQNCSQYMKHGKRKRLTTEDFNIALKRSDVQGPKVQFGQVSKVAHGPLVYVLIGNSFNNTRFGVIPVYTDKLISNSSFYSTKPVYGHRYQEGTSFRQTKEGEIFFIEDMEINLSDVGLEECIPKNIGETSIKAHWLAVEGISKSTSSSQQTQGKPLRQGTTDTLQKYYDSVTNAVLGSDEKLMQIALKDLRTNSQIVPLLPYFVNFISNGVKTVSHDVGQLTRLLYTANALINNSSLYLEPQPYLNLLVQGVSYCLLESLAASINPANDHWALRDYAARVLAQIVHCWASPVNHLMQNTIKSLKDVLFDLTKPFCCHYGAVIGLQALGPQMTDDILIPYLPTYWPHLSGVLDDNSYSNAVTKSDAFKVYGAILFSVRSLLKLHIKHFEDSYFSQSTTNEIFDDDQSEKMNHIKEVKVEDQTSTRKKVTAFSDPQKTIACLYNEMYEYFGDRLCIHLPNLSETLKEKVFQPKFKEKLISLSDPDSQKSGEELLKEFMEQVKVQQQMDREKAEKERIKKLVEEERRARERKHYTEHQKLMEAGKKRLEEIRKAELQREREEMERLEHETRRNKKIAEERISKMLQADSDDDFDDVVPYRPTRKRSRSQVNYFPADTVDSEDDPSYSVPGTSGAKGTGIEAKGIKLKIITRPGRLPNVKIEQQSKEVKKSPHGQRTKASPHHHKEVKYSPKLSPHVYREAKHSPHTHREPKSSPHTHKDSPHMHRDSPYTHKDSPVREPKYSHHSSLHKDFRDSPNEQGDSKPRKRKSSQKSVRKDEFEFESDPEDFTPLAFKSSYYSSEGESSEGAEHRKPLKMKLKVKDSKEFSSE